MTDLIEEFVGLRHWTVVGASQQRHKFGNIILRNLHAAGYEVNGVHPDGVDIDGVPVYPSLSALPALPEVVNLVVPPAVTMDVVQECHELGLTRVWMQPGAESRAAVAFCRAHDIAVIAYGPCALVERRVWTS